MILEQTTDFASGVKPHKYVSAGMRDIKWGTVIALLIKNYLI